MFFYMQLVYQLWLGKSLALTSARAAAHSGVLELFCTSSDQVPSSKETLLCASFGWMVTTYPPSPL